MLPTKGYFQDIECPYNNSVCGRPYCHFRHKKKIPDNVEEVVTESEKEESTVIPTYKPTPKSELANIHNKSHIPISYVPDLTFRRERKIRPLTKIEKPTYKPTPLSILSSANNRLKLVGDENGENIQAINEIKQNIANMAYDPATSLQPAEDIDFEELDSEFAIIDEIIRSTDFKKKKKAFTANSIDNKQTIDNCKPETTCSAETKPAKLVPKGLLNNADHNKESEKVVTENKGRDETEANKNNRNDIKDQIEEIKSETLNDKKKEHNEEKKSNANDKNKKYIESKNFKNSERMELLENTLMRKEEAKKIEIKTQRKEETKNQNKPKENFDRIKSSEKIKTGKDDKKDKDKSEKNEKFHKSSNKDKHRKEELTDRKDKTEKSRSHTKSRSRSRERARSNERSSDGQRSKDKSSKEKSRSSTKSRSRSRERAKSKERSSERNRSKDKSITKHKNREKSADCKSSKNENNERQKVKPKIEEQKTGKEHNRERRKSKERCEDRRKSKEHSEGRSKTKEKQKESNDSSRSKSKHDSKTDKSTSKNKLSSTKEKKKVESSTEESDSDRDVLIDQEIDDSLMDVDLDENVDETLLECYKIFNEYKPTPKGIESTSESEMFSPEHSSKDSTDLGVNEYSGKKRIAHATIERTYSQLHPPDKPKSVVTPGQSLANRYKLAKMAQANREQELLMNEIQQPVPMKRPAPSLLEAARARKMRKEQSALNQFNTNIVDDILKGSSNKTLPPPALRPKIAPAQNVLLMAKAKERLSKISQAPPKTVAQTQKGPRVAHVPDVSLADIPDVLQADKSKLPVNVRTRFLTMLADECVKMYVSKGEAYSRALSEEYTCYEKCNVLATYRNSAMLAVNRLRKEIQERNSNGLGLIAIGDDDGKTSEGKSKGKSFYDKIKKWILTEEELDIHGYPRESEECHGKAKIKNRQINNKEHLDENQRLCCRCKKVYLVDDDGWPLYEEECLYHPMKKRTIRGEQTYLCCRSSGDIGCATSDTHVSEGFSSADLEGFQTTLEPESEDDQRNYAVYALDCEMCYTTKGLELTRVTIVDYDCKTVYESLVKPLNPIIDYNTRFSGITKEQMDRTSTSILQVQANILHLCNSNTILIGHSLESDMKALKIVHGTIVDTSVLFPHKMGLPHKRALKALASEFLRKIIQNDVSGHDSAEDAVTCMELLKWKLKEEMKSRPSK